MRIKHGSVNLLAAANIPHSHAEKLQGVQTRLTGFTTDLMAECEFSYGLVFGKTFMPQDTFCYLIPHEALETKGSDAL